MNNANSNNPMPNIALIAASGVSETEMTAIQRALANHKWRAQVISPETGLLHSWGENSWGHCYPADAKIEVSLGSDFDMLIMPGGQRSVDKLMLNAHTKRIIGAMMAMKKPIVAFAEAERLLVENELSGDNVRIMSYANAEELAARAGDMVTYFMNNLPMQDDEELEAA